MKKISKMNELAWVVGIIVCALGVAFCTKSSLGLSMVAAPAYIIHITVSKVLSFYSQGMSEYIWQAFLLLLTCVIVKRFRLRYLFSFLSAFISGLFIDMWLSLLGGGGPYETIVGRILSFVIGECLIAFAIALIFRTYLPVQVVELIVIEISAKYKLDMNKVKLVNDAVSLILSIVLTLTLTGGFVGVGIGTIIITVVNAPLIKLFGKLLDKIFVFDPAFPKLKEFFAKI